MISVVDTERFSAFTDEFTEITKLFSLPNVRCNPWMIQFAVHFAVIPNNLQKCYKSLLMFLSNSLKCLNN